MRIINNLLLKIQLNHYRCKVGSVPVCRPDMDLVNGGSQCATISGTTETSLNNPGTTYTTLDLCNAEIYWGKSCYTASLTAPFFSVSTVFDHVTNTGCAVGGNVTDVSEIIVENGDFY